jgi:hypothetical protein
VTFRIIVTAFLIYIFWLAVNHYRVTLWEVSKKIPHFCLERVLHTVSSAITPPDFSGRICSGSYKRVEHSQYRRRPDTRAQQNNWLAAWCNCEVAPWRAYLQQVAYVNAIVQVLATGAFATLNAKSI